jgi:hypothetical protein
MIVNLSSDCDVTLVYLCGLSFQQNEHRLRHECNSHDDDKSVRCVFCEALENDMQHVDGSLDLDVVMEDYEWLAERKKMQDHLEELKKKLDAYCLQLICLGFNSAKYDINLVKTHIATDTWTCTTDKECSPSREITNTLV